jgi:hypothetical protein
MVYKLLPGEELTQYHLVFLHRLRQEQIWRKYAVRACHPQKSESHEVHPFYAKFNRNNR